MILASTADGVTVQLDGGEVAEFSACVRSPDAALDLCIYRNTRPTGYVSRLGLVTDVAWLSVESQQIDREIAIAVPAEIAEQIRPGTETKIVVRAAEQGNLQRSAVFDWPEAGKAAYPKREAAPIIRPRHIPPWLPIGGGAALLVMAAAAIATQVPWDRMFSRDACTADAVDRLIAGRAPVEMVLKTAQACRGRREGTQPEQRVAFAARLYRIAADTGSAEAALGMGEIYDPKGIAPGRLGQMPSPDFEIAFDNYRRAAQLGSTEAGARLAALRLFVVVKAQEGDSRAQRLLQRWP